MLKSGFFITIYTIISLFALATFNTDATMAATSGIQRESAFGGPTSVQEQLREDDEAKEPAFSFPGFD